MLLYENKYCNYPVYVQKLQYENGRVAIRLLHAEDGDPVAVATVNLPDEQLGEDEVFIKDWSENEGMLKFLTENNIVVDTGRRVPCGFVEAAVCKLL